ncbi:MAG TPA: hypothetical protein DCY45_06375 [Mesotoga sp.]|nr:hypothetical protein [Mesotoga sp.]
MLFLLVVILAVIVAASLIRSMSQEDEDNGEDIQESTEISFSQHAVSRMDERGIEPERIKRILEEGRRVEIANYNRLKVTDDEITVILEKRLSNFEVVTAYWNSGEREESLLDD